jgi:uncharacterized damage-inducible protein DinB
VKKRKLKPRKKKAAPKARPRKATTAKRVSAAAPPSHKRHYLNALIAEHAKTLRVIRAFPEEQAAFQPHPRSQTAKRLMWTFVMEQGIVIKAVRSGLTMPPGGMPPEPETLGEVLTAFERGAVELAETVARASNARLLAKTPFLLGPGKVGEVPIIDIMWMMLMDQIHHRGQLSVYIRMAGGMVPSIYGPSADEPWV